VSALQHFRAPDGLAPGPGYSHAATGRGRWVATAGQVALDDAGQLAMPGLMIEIEAWAIRGD
jgi:enamine deaminase RidA (YjgF/YER057c/UK114 family)